MDVMQFEGIFLFQQTRHKVAIVATGNNTVNHINSASSISPLNLAITEISNTTVGANNSVNKSPL